MGGIKGEGNGIEEQVEKEGGGRGLSLEHTMKAKELGERRGWDITSRGDGVKNGRRKGGQRGVGKSW